MKRKSDTQERLIHCATDLFARKWYGTVSVAEICREAGLSNGVFYRYFDGKEELFKSILSTTHDQIAEAIGPLAAEDPQARLASFVETLIGFSAQHPDLVSVFREGQYRFIEYERALEELYRQGLCRVIGIEVGVPENVFALGGIRFCATRAALQGVPIVPASVLAIIEGGLFPGMEASPEKVFAEPSAVQEEESAGGSAEALLLAGKRLFGSKGFFETNIHEITDAADLSVGAFYMRFPSKEAFYSQLIERAGRDIRRFIAANIGEGLNRLEREMRGLWLFVRYLERDKDCYGIVREAEFVLPADVRSYYGAFVDGYRRRPLSAEGLAPGIDEGTAIEFLIGINHYLGIEAVFSDAEETGTSARAKVEAIGAYLAAGFARYLTR